MAGPEVTPVKMKNWEEFQAVKSLRVNALLDMWWVNVQKHSSDVGVSEGILRLTSLITKSLG